MTELYWLAVLGNLGKVLSLFTILGIIVLAISFIIAMVATIDLDDDEGKSAFKECIKISKVSAIIACISLLINVFIPNTKELYAIYGIGTVIDYAKDNKEVRKIPDNAIKAINSYLESLQEDKKDSNKK